MTMVHDIGNETIEASVLLAVCACPRHGGVVHDVEDDSAGPDIDCSGVVFFLVEFFWSDIGF